MVWIPGIDEIGSGYDYLNGQYAQSESCTENLFDWSNVPTYERKHNGQTYIIPNIVSFYPKRAVEYISVAGENLYEYHQSISNTVNIGASILGFTGSLDMELGKVVDYSKFRKFSRIQYDYSSHLLHLTSSLSMLRKYLKLEIRSEINDPKLDPETIFDKYGTHFISSLKMGGRVVLSASTNKLNYNSKANFKLVTKAAALEIFNGEISEEYKEEIKKFRSNSDFNLNACGGDVSALGNDMMHPNMDKWVETIPNNPVFITFDRSKSLSFIGDLAEGETRRKQFIDAWPIYANNHRRKFKSFDPPYLEYMYVTFTTNASRRVYDDGKVYTLGTKPAIKEGSKWKWLAVSYLKDNEEKYGILIREKPYAEGLLRPIVKKNVLDSFNWYQQVEPLTDDPDEFVSLGGFIEYAGNSSYSKLYPVDINNLVGVHQSLCVHGKPGESFIGQSWYIVPQDGTLHLSTITCSNNSSPIRESIWLLRMDFIVEIENFNHKL
ncbi:MAC/Perforin domain protein [Gigaspora margarita]|uniref:MAC/Perforin domain protein n=1 Tax=Gigaspora margarita TaxID=4874 RepID=A0A8H4ELT3_GIGMA|nr:MAC/Perforin domain protein [Gigaspora margarita]